MTTTSVKDVGSVMNLGVAAGAPAAKGGKTAFQDVWSTQTGKGSMAQNGAAQAGKGREAQDSLKTAKPAKASKPGENLKSTDRGGLRADRGKKAVSDVAETGKPGEMSEEELEEAMEVVAAAAGELIQQIADLFQIPVEDVQDLMQDLDLQPADLLQPGNLSNLLLEAGGAQDSLALLTDEQLYADFQTLMEQGRSALEQVSEALRMKPEQVAEMIRQAGENAAEDGGVQVPVPEQEVQMSVETVGAAERENSREREPVIEVTVQREGAAGETELKSRARDEAETARQDPDSQNIQGRELSGEETVQASGKEQPAGNDTSQDRKDGGEHSEHRRQEGNPVLQTIRNDEFQPQPENVQETAKTWSTDTQDLMRQIMDYMRIQVRADVSNLEMQLHPASLGTLQIQLASRGGVLTANFITQNEAVKATLESQMIQLKESFEQQGVKVEAIEVTVETHEFKQNLEQGSGGQPQESGERKNRTRRITLDALGGMDGSGELEEADRLTAEMMAADGNTVDYTA